VAGEWEMFEVPGPETSTTQFVLFAGCFPKQNPQRAVPVRLALAERDSSCSDFLPQDQGDSVLLQSRSENSHQTSSQVSTIQQCACSHNQPFMQQVIRMHETGSYRLPLCLNLGSTWIFVNLRPATSETRTSNLPTCMVTYVLVSSKARRYPD